MATDWEINEFFGPRDFRKKADYDQRRPKKNPEIILPVKVTRIWAKKRSSHHPLLFQCLVTGCRALLGPRNVRHYSKVHGMPGPPKMDKEARLTQTLNGPNLEIAEPPATQKVSPITAALLAKEIEEYLPAIIVRIANDAGPDVVEPEDEISLETAATIRAFFKRLSS